MHEICSYRSLIDTSASEVKCLRIIERRDLSNERNTFKSKTIFYHKITRLKPERATRPIPNRRRPLYATATRPIPKRRRPLYATATTQILNLSNLLKGSDIKRTSRRTVLLKGSDIKRTSRRTALLKSRNTRTIQLPLRHLKGIGIVMTPLSDWLILRDSELLSEVHVDDAFCKSHRSGSIASSKGCYKICPCSTIPIGDKDVSWSCSFLQPHPTSRCADKPAR